MLNLKDWAERYPWLRSPMMGKLLIILGGGVLLLFMSSSWLRGPAQQSTPQPSQQTTEHKQNDLAPAERELEIRLQHILSAVAGAGSVEVTVTLETGPERVYARNLNKQNQTVEEKDTSGGARTTSNDNEQSNLVFSQGSGGVQGDPVVEKETRPTIAGVLVLADGASNAVLREKLAHAVETVLDIPPYKVIVMPKESR